MKALTEDKQLIITQKKILTKKPVVIPDLRLFFIYTHVFSKATRRKTRADRILRCSLCSFPHLPVATSISDTKILLSSLYWSKTNYVFPLDSETGVRSHALPEVILVSFILSACVLKMDL
jgi:hypothetical protein